jgi:molybdopterin-guanine dinucleotide biosynthesis protein A
VAELEKITGIVLAGGKSSRMGQDKGLMLFHGKAMVTRVMEQLQPCVDELLIVANTPAYGQFGYPVVADLAEAAGPVGGIYTGLTHTSTELNFFVSCDTPFIITEAIRKVIAEAGDAAVATATLEGRIQPLFGLYRKSNAVVFRECIRQKKYKLQAVIREINHRLVPLDGFTSQHPHLLHNINTPEEFAEALTYSAT